MAALHVSSSIQWDIVLFVIIGAAVSWSKYGRDKLRVYFLSNIIDIFCGTTVSRPRQVIELLIFILLGCIISIKIVEPSTSIQALTAGFGWTGILTTAVKR